MTDPLPLSLLASPGDGLADELAALAERLVAALTEIGPCVVAYSGGVDSAVVAKAAAAALGDQALAATGVSPSLASGELDAAAQLAAEIGIRHVAIATDEFARDGYLSNGPDRCFHCKTELYTVLRASPAIGSARTIVNGANADDLHEFRPGLQAAAEHAIRSPLAELGLDKRAVRRLAAYWGLAAWDKPATPCLSSRVAYGVSVTPERLARIDNAEQHLRRLGFSQVRVRCHENDLARVEVSAAELPRLATPEVREQLVRVLREAGFNFVTLDLEGFRTGSFKTLVPAAVLEKFAVPEADGAEVPR
ncbi:MAG: ATP-dependent sacrificial sulfur transferase LarE [Pirellulales bacterium]|nr:ATP-dependent sacrificial sulfur transferase LarE [Pirellulales bacterium]